jgi:hypothetical protein
MDTSEGFATPATYASQSSDGGSYGHLESQRDFHYPESKRTIDCLK